MQRLNASRRLPWHRDWLAWLMAWALAFVILWPYDARAQSSTCCTVAEWELIGITSQKIAEAFLWGFGSIIFFWVAGWCVGVAVSVVRKA